MSKTCPPWPQRITITVTAEDVAHGKRGDCQMCPAALALHRKWRGIGWRVNADAAEAQDETGRARYRYSERLYEAICNFDHCNVFPVGSYHLTRTT